MALLFCLSLLSGPAAAVDLPIVFEEYPPYEYTDNGVVKGINMDLIREAFRRMDITPIFEARPWKRALFELEYGEVLALSSGFKTPKRETFAIFPSESLSMETLVVVALSVSGVEVNSLDDLRGLKVGVIREYSYGHEFDSMQGLTKIQASSNPQLLKMLLNQRMDVVIANKAVMKHLAREMGEEASIKFVYKVTSEPLYLFFSRARGVVAEGLARDSFKAIRSMHEDGTFKAIESSY